MRNDAKIVRFSMGQLHVNTMRKVVFLSLFTIIIMLGMFTSSSANAQMQFGVQGNIGDDIDFGVGARLTANLGNRQGLGFTAAFDYFFPDFVDYFEVNGNVTYTFPISNTSFAPYAGGGITLGHASAEWADVSDNEIMPSVLGGFKLLTNGGMTPFLELRIELSGYEQFVITGGVLF